MEIVEKKITVRELTDGYMDEGENGVVAYGGKLDVRPPYQREFIYSDKERQAVINTVLNGYPLNIMYWAVREDGTFEIIDGQQRTLSICQYVANDFSFNFRFFTNLQPDEKERILNYELTVYLCSGSPSEKLEWFKIINTPIKQLTPQEMLNAVYAGPWVTDAKRYFSKSGCVASKIAGDYVNGSPIRQEIFEIALDWISHGNGQIYMSNHQHDPNASALWLYFQSVITWVESTFKKRPKIMKGVDWGALYNKYHENVYNTEELEKQISKLILDDDVTNKKGIYPYVLTGNEKYLNIRAFTDSMKIAAYERQEGICPVCGKYFLLEQMEADHITPWSKGGATNKDNCQMLCQECNRRKSDK